MRKVLVRLVILWYKLQVWRAHRALSVRQAQYRFWFAEVHKPDVHRVIRRRADRASHELHAAEDRLYWAKWNIQRLGG